MDKQACQVSHVGSYKGGCSGEAARHVRQRKVTFERMTMQEGVRIRILSSVRIRR